MRIDARMADGQRLYEHCRVFLEGAERCNVVAADEEARWALVMRLDQWGDPVRNKAGKPLTDQFYGHVRIECPEWVRDQAEEPDEAMQALNAALFAWAMPLVTP